MFIPIAMAVLLLVGVTSMISKSRLIAQRLPKSTVAASATLCEDDTGNVVSQEAFVGLASAAIAAGCTLDLEGRRVELHEPFQLTASDVLRVTGGSIVGDGHALFHVGGSRSGLLEIVDCELAHRHSSLREEKRARGAAILVRGKGRLELRNCTISSQAGFGLWLVQKGRALVTQSTFTGSGRSTICAFENARIELQGCTILDAQPHAVCARGDTRVTLHGCTILRAEVRAIYCYHSSALEVVDTLISGTRLVEAAAVQIDALRAEDCAAVTLRNTRFCDNAGGDLSVAGNVVRDVQGCSDLVERAPEPYAVAALRERDDEAQRRVTVEATGTAAPSSD
jgi:hypothetical protein